MANENANFTPTFKGYTGQQPFRYWCQTVLPLVYDDSLSYYELLNKIVVYLNNVISDVSNVEDNVQSLYNAYDQLQGYVNAYFDNLDVQSEINHKLDEMAEDGTLSDLISPYVSELIGGVVEEQIGDTVAEQIGGTVAGQINAVVAEQIGTPAATATTAWLNANVNPVGSAVMIDTSLTISGAAADAKVVGDKFADVDEALNHLVEVEHWAIRNGYYISGVYTADNGYKCKVYDVESLQGKKVFVSTYVESSSMPIISFFVNDQNYISQALVSSSGYYTDYEATVPSNARYATVSCVYGTVDDVQYTSNNIHMKKEEYVSCSDMLEDINTIQNEMQNYRAPMYLNQWYGKKVVWIGTSGSFGTNATTSYPKELSEHLEFELINASVPGQAIHTTSNGGIVASGSTCLSKAEYQALGVSIAQNPLPYVPGGSYNNYYRTYENIFTQDNADADLWVFDVFPNNTDWSTADWDEFDRELWRYNDNSNFASHRTTFYGALLFLLNELYNLNPEARVVFIIGAANRRAEGRVVADKLANSALRYRTFDVWGLINSNVKTNTYLYSLGGTDQHPSTKAHEIMGKILIGNFLNLA